MSRNKRREWIKQSTSVTAGLLLGSSFQSKAKSIQLQSRNKTSVVVAGAGIMGCWTAYFLHKSGYDVTLCDPYGAGNPRASSGGETRLIRYMYGKDEVYFDMAKRARKLWVEEGKTIGKQLFFNTGLLIFSEKATYDYAEASKGLYQKAGLKLEKISADLLKAKYPFLHVDDLDHAVYDTEAGYALAADSCKAILEYLKKSGVKFLLSGAKPGKYKAGKLQNIILNDGSMLSADYYIFANGPWMPKSFPELLQTKINITRQPVMYFGAPADSLSKDTNNFPVWMNRDAANKERAYGVYESNTHIFKMAYTQMDPVGFDPTASERTVHETEVAHARYLMEKRFAFMKDAPLLYTKVCQHTDTPDKDFLLGKHPEASNLWLVGGGSGHAFKHGPAIGEKVNNLMLGKEEEQEKFSLSRLNYLKDFTKNHK